MMMVNEVLVAVYMVRELADAENETLYARYEDGRIETATRKYSPTFFNKGDAWEVVAAIPGDAEFIGNYYMPVKGGRA